MTTGPLFPCIGIQEREFQMPPPACSILTWLYVRHLIPLVIVVSFLLAPGCACLPDRDQRPILDRRELQQGSYAGFGAQSTPTKDVCTSFEGTPCDPPTPGQVFLPPTDITNISNPTSPSLPQPPPPNEDGCLDGTCPPPPPHTVQEPGPPRTEPPTGTTPVSPSLPPPRPPKGNPQWPKGNPNPNRNVTPTDEAEQGRMSNSKVASVVGWVFLTAALALQVILGSYLSYKRRELERFGTRLEKVPSVSPPPSPAGFASSTAAL